MQNVMACLLDLDTRAGDRVDDDASFDQGLAADNPLFHPAAHFRDGAFRRADGTHTQLNAPETECRLDHGESRSFLTQQIAGRHAYIVEDQIDMAERRVVEAENRIDAPERKSG